MDEYIEQRAATRPQSARGQKGLNRRSILRPCPPPTWLRWCMDGGKESHHLIGGGHHLAR